MTDNMRKLIATAKKVGLSAVVTICIVGFGWYKSNPPALLWAASAEPKPSAASSSNKRTGGLYRSMKCNGVPMSFLQIESRLSPSRMAESYRNSHRRRGWEDLTDVYKELGEEYAERLGVEPQITSRPLPETIIMQKGTKTFLGTFQRDPARHGTVAVLMTIDAGKEDLHKAFPKNSAKDAPGGEPPGVPRYPSSKRKICIEQEIEGRHEYIVAYHGRGTVGSHYRFYLSRMKDRGWDAEPLVEGTNSKKSSRVVSFQKGTERCLITIRRRPKGGGTDTLVMYTHN